MRMIIGATALLAAFAVPLCVHAQDAFPNKPIRVVIPFAPGGSGDIVVRLVSDKFQQLTGQPLVSDHRGGASGIIAAEFIARSAPDGYTLMLASVGQMSLNPHSFTNLPYDPVTTFAPVSGLVATNYFWAVHPDVPATTLREYVAWAKANPERANFGSTGIGTPSHLAGVMLAQASGAPLVNVPYKGTGPAITGLLGGQVSAAFVTLVLVKDAVRTGRLRVLAAATEKRVRSLPDMPTFGDLGYPEVVAPLWSAMLAPAGTPPAVIERLSRAINQALASPEVAEKMIAADQEPFGTTPAQLAEFMRVDRERWGRAFRDSGFKPTAR